MSDRVTHVSFGVLISVGRGDLLSYLSTSDPITMVVFAIAGGFWGSTFPDLVEPPINYNHRGFFHSVGLLKRIPVVMIVSLLFSFYDPRFWLLFYSCFGYALHLLADATTPMRLPGMRGFRNRTFFPRK